MRFGIYSEMQYWGDRSPRVLYAEIMEQTVNADRLGYDVYSLVEHFFFERFSISPDPLQVFAASAQHARRIRFRTLLHLLPLHNPAVLASRIAEADLLLDGRYEFGVGRGHAWIPETAGIPAEETKARYAEGLEALLAALANERFSSGGEHYRYEDSHIVPRPSRPLRLFAGGASNETYERAGELGWAVCVSPLMPFAALEERIAIYRESSRRSGNDPYIAFIRPCHVDEDADTAHREAEPMMRRFLEGNAWPITSGGLPPKETLAAAGYEFYASGLLERLAQKPYEQLVEDGVVWVGTPADIVHRIETLRQACPDISEISISVSGGGAEHWKAIKTQELFAAHVMPGFRERGGAEPTPARVA